MIRRLSRSLRPIERRCFSSASADHFWTEAHDELLPPLSIQTYQRRRLRVLQTLPKNCILLAPPASAGWSGHDIPLPWKQSADVLWCGGAADQESWMAWQTVTDDSHIHAFVRPRNPSRELWDGPRLGPEVALSRLQVDACHSVSDLPQWLSTLLSHGEGVSGSTPRILFTTPLMAGDRCTAPSVREMLERLAPEVRDAVVEDDQVRYMYQSLREVKNDEEISLLQRAGSIGALAMKRAMEMTEAGVYESFLGGTITQVAQHYGAHTLAYPPVVAAARNALTLHYIQCTTRVRDGDLILLDAGVSYHGYCSDITRTWPVSGRFSEAQREVYEEVLKCMEACRDLAVVGSSISALHKHSVLLLSESLLRLGILRSNAGGSAHSMAERVARSAAYQRFYPHAIGHQLGLDVHDSPILGYMRPLRPGMVITIEPGLYIPDDPDVPERYRGIGIRLEDDLLIRGPDHPGPLVLTSEVPLHPEEVEAAVRGGRTLREAARESLPVLGEDWHRARHL